MPPKKKTTRRRAPKTASRQRVTSAAIRHGRRQAQTVLALRKRAVVARASAASPGLVVAEGDSWFDYPFFDVLERLEDRFDYRVESVAHKGDTVEEMAYDTTQLAKLARLFEKVK